MCTCEKREESCVCVVFLSVCVGVCVWCNHIRQSHFAERQLEYKVKGEVKEDEERKR